MNEDIIAQSIARKYARAYINVFGTMLSADFLSTTRALRDYLLKHREAFFYLKLSVIPSAVKEHIVIGTLNKFNVDEIFFKLVTLLTYHRRLHLLLYILNELIKEYKRLNKLEEFIVTTSHPIADDEIAQLQTMLEWMTGYHAHIKTDEDQSLIAGIRALSDEHKWEHSVRQLLNHIERSR